MKKQNATLFCWLLFFVSCASNNVIGLDSEHVETISYKNSQKVMNIHSLDLIEKINIVQLYSDSVIIGNISNIICYDSILYILDRDMKKCVYIFNMQGRHIATLSKLGHGQGEYTQLSDIFIDRYHSTLNLVCRAERKLLVYDLQGHKLLKEQKIPKTFDSMVKIPDGYVGYMGNYTEDTANPDNYWIMDDSLSIKESCLPINKLLESRVRSNIEVFSAYDDRCDFISQMCYNVYSIKDMNPAQTYQFNFGALDLPEQTKEDMDNPQTQFKNQNNYICDIDRFQETKHHILAYFIFQGQPMMLVHNKDDKSTKMATLDPNEKEYLLGFGDIKGMDQHHIYTVESAESLYNIYQGHDQYNDFMEKYPNQIKNLRKKIKSPSKDGNPYIIIYSIK